MLFQLNKFPNGSRGRSDLLGQMDWLDAYDSFLFAELDRIDYLRRFVWDVTLTGTDPEAVKAYEKSFKAPEPNSTFVHNDQVKLEAKSPNLQAADTSESARLLRNHVLGGATVPEHWFGGGGDVNRSAASEMGEPTFKMYSMRQGFLKRMLEEMGRYVLWANAQTTGEKVVWSEDRWQVTAVFPELLNRDITKFAAAMQSVSASVILSINAGLLTEETALKIVADIAQRFGQDIDAKTELANARKQMEEREKKRAAADLFGNPAADVAAEMKKQNAQQEETGTAG